MNLYIKIILSVFVCWLFWALCFSAPSGFPLNKVITIEKGKTFNEISAQFKEQRLMRSSLVFETIAWLLRKEKEVKAGEYFFEQPVSVVGLLKIIVGNSYKTNFAKITIPEGFTLRDIASLFEGRGLYSADEFEKAAGPELEGFLFPDTYYVPLDITPDSMVMIMRENFDKKITPELEEEIAGSGHSLSEILTMASLLEKEASQSDIRRIISDILWKRLAIGMLLQVDAIFPYVLGKNSFQLTLDDLKIDSLYNTYLHKGLPPGPICNPGLDAIRAALEPTSSPYWYYLSDKEGDTYFSKTYEEHLAKKEKYLK